MIHLYSFDVLICFDVLIYVLTFKIKEITCPSCFAYRILAAQIQDWIPPPNEISRANLPSISQGEHFLLGKAAALFHFRKKEDSLDGT